MKRNLIMIAGLFAGITYTSAGYAQQTDLVADQNPRYAESVNKYSRMADSLTYAQGTTVQETYKAYDWYEAREERRRLRRERNYQLSLYGGYTNYDNSWSYPGYNNYWNYGGYSRYLYPSFGFRTRNFWFGF
jgi:hypothetical protein